MINEINFKKMLDQIICQQKLHQLTFKQQNTQTTGHSIKKVND